MRLASSLKMLLLAGVAASAAMVSLSQATEIIFRAVDSNTGSIIEREAPVLSFAPASNLLFGAVPLSEPARFTGPSSSYPVGLTRLTAMGGQIRICEDANCTTGTAWSTTAPVRNGQYVQARGEALATPGQRVSVAVTAEGLSASFEATARSSPASFGSLASVTRSPGGEGESGLSTFNGWVSTAVIATGGDVRICQESGACTDWVASGTVRDGDEVQLRGVAGVFGETRTVTASAGGATARFEVIARAKDTTPDTIAFGTGPTNVEPASTSTSPVVTLAGFDDAPISISGTGARYSLNGSAFTAAAGTARPGDTVRVELVAGAFGERRTATLTVGGTQAVWSSTVRVRDTTPDAISNFTSLTNQTAGATVVSDIRQLRNHDGVTASVSGANATMRVCSTSTCSGGTVGAWVTAASVARDQYVQLQAVAPAGGTTATASLSYGAGSPATWSVTSQATDLYAFTSHTFTSCSAAGQNGPTLTQCRSAYSTVAWAQTSALSMPMQGYQAWTVPSTGTYEVTVVGARGGAGQNREYGKGRAIRANFSLTRGEVILIAIGQRGRDAIQTTAPLYAGGGGGGGTFVARGGDVANAIPFVVAGGGGGTSGSEYGNSQNSDGLGIDARYDNSGDISRSTQNAFLFGNGASFSATGRTNTPYNGFSNHALSFRAGMTGGYSSGYQTMGGFGGGGAPDNFNGAGGGGFSGGAGGRNRDYQGEGGGSYVAPSRLLERDLGATGTDNGQVTIKKL